MELRKQKSIDGKHEAFEKSQLNGNDNELEEKIATEKKLVNLEEALKQLKPEQQSCIQLFYIEEKSYQEVATITGFEIKKVKSYIQNGKRNLKILMTEG